MADSNTTKQALSVAFKALLVEQSFDKISVSDICDRCGLNRKTFYYHFRDKFDLANWIFDTEFAELVQKKEIDVYVEAANFEERWDSLATVCAYFYDNRQFYRSLFQVRGQNSFSEHFRGFMRPILQNRTELLLGRQDVPQMVYDFLVDGIVCSFERWLLDKKCATAEEFLQSIKYLLQIMVYGLGRRIQAEPDWLASLYQAE